jgi:flagellar biosynthesis component FlhA
MQEPKKPQNYASEWIEILLIASVIIAFALLAEANLFFVAVLPVMFVFIASQFLFSDYYAQKKQHHEYNIEQWKKEHQSGSSVNDREFKSQVQRSPTQPDVALQTLL